MSPLRFSALIALALATIARPGRAMVGGAPVASDGVARSVVTIVGSRGNFCTGTLIAPDLVLSAAHCVGPGADYRVIVPGENPPSLREVSRVAAHPQFNMQSIFAHRATADTALLQLAQPLTAKTPIAIGAPREPITSGAPFTVAGVGVTRRGDGKSAGQIRTVSLVATGHPGRLQIRLVDPAADNKREGQGACTGDSGGPAVEERNGRLVVVGVVSWSTGPRNGGGCGGLTGITPLTLYRDWIEQTARSWGSKLR